MWLVRSILVFGGIVAILVFAISNVDQRANVVVFTRTYQNVHLNLALLLAALFGAAICFAVMIWREVALRALLRRARRENMRLDDELVALRNLPLSGLQSPPNRPHGPVHKL